jgi:ubiquinone/menaquinone biosynthesis C-methylase UbiE
MCNTPNVLQAARSAAKDAPAGTFAERLVELASNATTGLMISIGHRTNLFEALKEGPATSVELAERARLNERYVREWLGALTTAGIIKLEPATNVYRLPSDHAEFLGRDASGGNMAAMFQFIAVLGGVESRIVDCFRYGGGVPYEAYERFHEVMAEESAQTVVAALDEFILPLVPGLQAQLEAGVDVADIGCGSGRAINYLAALYPNSRFHGIDLCQEAINAALHQAKELGLSNVEFTAMDATHLPGQSRFDVIFTFDAVHDQAQPGAVLANIRRLLKPGGVYLMQDIDSQTAVADNVGNPLAPFIYAISCMHCMTVSLAQDGEGLGAAWGEQLALSMLADAGFSDVSTHRLEHDIMNLYYVCR